MERLFDDVTRLTARGVAGLEQPRVQAILYNTASVILVAIAVWLRFHELNAPLLWLDEAVAAENAAGPWAQVLHNTATHSGSPILHPLLLHLVQAIDGSAWALRAASALGSVLAIAAMLALLPRVGVARSAAFLAALMALTSVEALRQAQIAREYSIDVLFAVLTLAGCLAALRQRRVALLASVLFLGPLLQYGLALLGGATLATLFVAHGLRWRRAGGIAGWLRAGAWLVVPTIAFAAGCALTYALTLRHQGITSVPTEVYGFVPLDHLYEGAAGDVLAWAQFAVAQAWGFLTYHVPHPVAAVGLVALGVAVGLMALRRAGGRAIPTLLALAVAVGMAAATLRLYPFGGVRHTMYLSAIAFIALGHGIHTALAMLPGLWRRAAVAAAAAGIAVLGAVNLSGHAYAEQGRAEVFLNTLQQRVGEDPILVPFNSAPILRFYERQHAADWRYMPSCPLRDEDRCRDAVMEVLLPLREEGQRRVWAFSFVRDYVEGIIAGWWRGGQARYAVGAGTLHGFLIEDLDVVLEGRLRVLDAHDDLTAKGLALGDQFAAFLDSAGRRVMVGKAPCRRIETWGTFMLRVTPVNRDDLPPERREYGVDKLDFKFDDQGQRFHGKCLAVATLPSYPITRIDAGQHNAGGKILWARSFHTSAGRAARRVLAAAPTPIISGGFNVHRHGRSLAYVKEGCRAEDTAAPFFLHVTPANPAHLGAAEGRGQDGVQLEFHFDPHGVRDMDTCLVQYSLPDFEIAAIETGQGEPGAEAAWAGTARFD